jgi:hypothetical protein
VPLDERVEVNGVEVSPRWIGETRNVARLY